jgi:hypothetical protein
VNRIITEIILKRDKGASHGSDLTKWDSKKKNFLRKLKLTSTVND